MTTDPSGLVPEFTICDRLRKARELTGLDQTPFAAEIGVSRGTVSTYERDEDAAFKPIVLKAWAMRSGVSFDWLMGKRPSGPTPPAGSTGADLAALTRRKRSRSHGVSGATDGYLAA